MKSLCQYLGSFDLACSSSTTTITTIMESTYCLWLSFWWLGILGITCSRASITITVTMDEPSDIHALVSPNGRVWIRVPSQIRIPGTTIRIPIASTVPSTG
jgi:hypothetical protein